MTISRLIKIFLLLGMMGSQLVVAQVEQHNSFRKNKVNGDRIEFIKRLLENSSAARKVKQSDNPVVSDLYKEAWLLYKRAVSARDNNDPKVMNEALSHATETMFKAVRFVKHKKLLDKKKQMEFNQRMDSINALLKAHKRISEEKNVTSQYDELAVAVHKKVDAANDLVSKGKINAAYVIVDEAYVQIKIAISKLRNGDTLIRSLHFATAKDEYLYEMDRNDTHKMLVKLLLEEKLKSLSVKKRTQGYLDKAKLLRQEAEKHAADNDYKAAIKSCEKSTQQYVRAIRAAGLYIPG